MVVLGRVRRSRGAGGSSSATGAQGDEFGGEQAVLFGEGLLLLFGLVAHHLPRCLEYTFDIHATAFYSAAPTRSVNQPHNSKSATANRWATE